MVSNKVIFYINLTNYNLQVLQSYIQYKHTPTHTHIPTFLTIRDNKFLSQCYTHKTLESIKTSTIQQIPLICCLN